MSISRSRRRASSLILLPLLLFSACGDSTGPEHPLSGDWAGSFVFTPAAETSYSRHAGSLEIRVDPKGGLSGTITVGSPEVVPVTGRLEPDGALEAAIEGLAIQGRLHAVCDGVLQGEADQSVNGQAMGSLEIELSRSDRAAPSCP